MTRGVRRRITSMLVDGVDAVGVVDLSGFTVNTVGRKQTLTVAGGGAPTNATYVVVSLSGSLSAERRAQASSPLSLTDGGANGDLTWGIQTASGAQAGALSAADWTTFNAKASAASVTAAIATAEAYSDAALAAHVAAADPHPQYTTAAEMTAYAQPLDADLTSIAALATNAYGRALLTLADLAALVALFSASAQTLLNLVAVRGGILISTAAATFAQLAIGTTGKYLRSDGTDPSWAALAAADLTGTVAIANGGTGAAAQPAARDAMTKIHRMRAGINRNAASTYAFGVGAPAIAGNTADTTIALGNAAKCATSSSINTNAGIAVVTANHAFIFYQETWEFFFATAADITSQRLYIGFGQSSLVSNAVNSPPNNCAFVGYDSGVSANWYLSNKDGTTATSTDTAVAVVASTTYRVRGVIASGSITWEISTLTAGAWSVVYSGTAITTNIPATTTGCGYGVEIRTLAAAIRSFFFVAIDVWSNSTG